MFPFDDYEENRDFLYGIFDEEEQINDKLILFTNHHTYQQLFSTLHRNHEGMG